MTSDRDRAGPAARFVALFLLSGVILGYELLLMRLLALAWWGHFASFVVSLSMLGLGASGLLLSFVRERVARRPTGWFAAGAILFGLLAPGVWTAAQALPFSPYLLVLAPREHLLLAARVALFSLPFLAGGFALGVMYLDPTLGPRRAYGASMLGPALAAGAILAALHFASPVRLIAPLAGVALLAAALALAGARRIAALGGALLVCLAAPLVPFSFSEYKEISRVLLLPESRIISETRHPALHLAVVAAPHLRRHAGLSLDFHGVLPPARFLFQNGGNLQAVYDLEAALADTSFIAMMPEELAYELRPPARVLLLEHAGGLEILRAAARGRPEVTVLEDPPLTIETILEMWRRDGELPESLPRIEIVSGPRRAALARLDRRFDLIHVSLQEKAAAAVEGGASLSADWSLTREAVARLIGTLADSGILVFTARIENPPRAVLKLAATIATVLREDRGAAPAERVMALRGWATTAIIVSPAPFTAAERAAAADFALNRGFDFIQPPPPAGSERFHFMADDPYEKGFAALLGPEAAEFIARYPFALAPATDDRPFFGHFLRWGALAELRARHGADWLPYVEWNYLLHLAALLTVGLVALGFFLAPCLRLKGLAAPRTILHFFALGAGYMFIEIHAIKWADRMLGSPLLAAAAVLATMLAASGLGALLLVERRRARPGRVMVALLVLLGIHALGARLVAPYLETPDRMLGASLVVLWLAPPAFLMGFPFPFSLGALKERREIPWALALNGIGAVLGSLVALLVAVHFGLTALALAGLAAYCVAAVTGRWNPPPGTDR